MSRGKDAFEADPARAAPATPRGRRAEPERAEPKGPKPQQ